MAPARVVCLSLFILFLQIRAEPESSYLIRPGSSLYANSTNSSWLSPSGRFAFGFYPQGNNGFAVGIWLISKSNITVVWTANRDDPPVSSNSSIKFTKDDKLLLQTGHGKQKRLVESFRDDDKPAVAASMLDSGNFKIYGDNISDVIWESFYYPTDTILGSQKFPPNEVIGYRTFRTFSSLLTSSKAIFDHSGGRFHLEKHLYEDIVAYAVNHTGVEEDFYWTIPGGKGLSELDLSPRGVLQLRSIDDNKTIQIIARSSYNPVDDETVIYRATLDVDGIFRLYSHRFKITGESNVSIEWSALQNQCEVKGICGFNSFCSTNNSKAECHCFPGFDFIDLHIKSRGCYKTFNDVEGCKTKDPVVFYSMTTLENTKLGGVPYAKLSVNMEHCSNSCLSDCYCGAAFYSNGTCYNFKLPLMFGTKHENESAAVFVKRSSGNNKRIRSPHRKRPNFEDRILAESKKNLIRVLGACLGSITFLCFLIAISSFLVYRHRVDRYKILPENPQLGLKQEFTLQSFNYNELEQATDGFKEELGRGEFGAVYKGVINEGKKNIAVKRLENPVEEGERTFRAEMAAISRTHHRNLVRLLGFCMEGSEKLLVYEYMSNGSLADLLFNGERRPTWTERVKIALDVARGILYLHEECEVQIIHCNINSRIILLDDYWTAKISNFGFAKLLMPNQTETQAGAPGRRGYMAPEWQKNALITVNSDVYSFGVVLLEILCCRRNLEVHVSKADEMLLSTWVYNCFIAGELNKFVICEEEVDNKTLERVVKVGLLCIQDDPNLRPSMKNVILMLEGTMNIPVPPYPYPSLVVT